MSLLIISNDENHLRNQMVFLGYEEKMAQLQCELKDLLIQEQKSRQDLLEVMKGLGYEL